MFHDVCYHPVSHGPRTLRRVAPQRTGFLMTDETTRRDFLQAGVAAGVALGLACPTPPPPPAGVATTVLLFTLLFP